MRLFSGLSSLCLLSFGAFLSAGDLARISFDQRWLDALNFKEKQPNTAYKLNSDHIKLDSETKYYSLEIVANCKSYDSAVENQDSSSFLPFCRTS